MSIIHLLRILVGIILVVLAGHSHAATWQYRSTIFLLGKTSGNVNQDLANFQDWLRAYKSIGLNSITLAPAVPFDPQSGAIKPAFAHHKYGLSAVTPQYLATYTDVAHSLGMKVIWKPNFLIDDTASNGNVSDYFLGPTFYPNGNSFNVNVFLSNLKDFWAQWAPIAQQHNVEMLVLGTEQGKFASAPYTNNWLDIIKATRVVYSGQLTYAEDHFEPQSWAPNVQFWGALDLIGIDNYMPLGNGTDNTSYPEAYKRMFENTLALQQPGPTFSLPAILYGLYKKFNKPIFFTEFGLQSMNGAMSDPTNVYSPIANYNEQANYFKANLDVWMNYDWIYGLCIWNQEIEAAVGPTNPSFPSEFQNYLANGFEFFNKPTADILKKYWVDQVAPPAIPAYENSNCLFDWAENSFPQLFSPPGASSTNLPPYYYRYYSRTGNYLATSSSDNHIWLLGSSFGNSPIDAGPTANLMTKAGCPQ